MVADRERSFRLRGIPGNWTQDDVFKLLQVNYDDKAARIKSLAPDPTCNRGHNAPQMATVNFEKIPERLKEYGGKGFINREIEVDDEFQGFTLLHSAPDDSCDIDIIAISGLNGHAFGSFKCKGGEAMWLRDFLPKHFPRSRIFIYGYDTKKDSFQSPSDIAVTFKHTLTRLRRNCVTRPWIVIGHSMGGVVAKIAIKRMAESRIREEVHAYKSLRAVFYFGVPSDGMNIESLRPLFKESAQRHLLENIDELKPAFLREVHSGYMSALDKLENCMSFYFYETVKSPTLVLKEKRILKMGSWILGRGWEQCGPPEKLVSELSATQGKLNENDPKHRVFPVDETHRDLVKFSSENDITYKTVVDHLKDIIVDMGKCDQGNHTLASGENRVTEIEEACLQSLAFQSMNWVKHDAQTTIHRSAFRWFFDNRKIEQWMTGRHEVLWILGYPESGKTSLMRFVTTHLREKSRENIVADVFVTSRSKSISNKPVRIYRSFLHQLSRLFPRILKSLAIVFQDNQIRRGKYGKKWKWAEEDLRDFTLKMLEKECSSNGEQKVFLFVDGINELGREPAERFIRTFNDFLAKPRKAPLNLRVCFSCRYSPNIRDGGLAISMDSENTQDIRYMVEGHRVMSRLRRHGDELQDLILERAQGSFGWISQALELVTDLYERGTRYRSIIAAVQQKPREPESKRQKGLAMKGGIELSSEQAWEMVSDGDSTAYEMSDADE